MTTVAIFGVGLIGSSLALALRHRRGARRLVGIDFSYATAAAGAFDDRVSAEDEAAIDVALAAADVVVLATPVHAIVARLPRVLGSAKIVTDTGSTKRAIANAAWSQPGAGRFVPGHPMAGEPRGGAERARADLFVGQRWILCPERSDPDAVAAVESMVRATGADIVRLSVEEHDRAVAVTSHLPQLLASALKSLSLQRGTVAAEGPGFASATRVAGGPEVMWRDVFESNADAIAAAGRELAAELAQALAALEQTPPDVEPALALLARARRSTLKG